jgi:hypothetical protein
MKVSFPIAPNPLQGPRVLHSLLPTPNFQDRFQLTNMSTAHIIDNMSDIHVSGRK